MAGNAWETFRSCPLLAAKSFPWKAFWHWKILRFQLGEEGVPPFRKRNSIAIWRIPRRSGAAQFVKRLPVASRRCDRGSPWLDFADRNHHFSFEFHGPADRGLSTRQPHKVVRSSSRFADWGRGRKGSGLRICRDHSLSRPRSFRQARRVRIQSSPSCRSGGSRRLLTPKPSSQQASR